MREREGKRPWKHHIAAAVALASAGLALTWATPPGAGHTASHLLVFAGAAALSYRCGWMGRAAAVALLATISLGAWLPDAPIPYAAKLRLEMWAAVVPLIALVLIARLSTKGAWHSRLLLLTGCVIAAIGSTSRMLVAWLLSGRSGDAATIRYALRLDAAEVLWGIASLAVLLSAAAGFTATRRRRRGHVPAVWCAAFGCFLLVSTGFPVLMQGSIAPPPALNIGFHANDVNDVPLGASIVHIEADMPTSNRAPGEYDFTNVQRSIDKANARGLDVYLLVSTYPPRWLLDAHPDSVMVDADGRKFTWIDEAPGAPRERVWEMSFADPAVAEARAAYVAAAVAALASHAAVRWVAVVNEPTYPLDWNLFRWASFDAATIDAFRMTLTDEVDGDLDDLNKLYRTGFESWQDVMPPVVPLGDYGERWITFREDLLIAHTVGLMDVARSHTDKPVTTKIMAHFLTRFAEPQAGLSDRVYRAMADASDVVSVDLYPVTKADLLRSLTYFRQLAGDKPLIIAEFNLALGAHVPFASLRMMSALETMAPHVDAVILFTASGHHLYGIEPGSAAEAATRAYGGSLFDPEYRVAVMTLLRGEAHHLQTWPAQTLDSVRLAAK